MLVFVGVRSFHTASVESECDAGGGRSTLSVAAPFVWRCLPRPPVAPVSTPTGWAEAVTRLRLPQNVACGFPALRSSGIGSQPFGCYSLESCCHGRRFISLHRWPYLPLHGGHVAFEQFNARWPLPHVAGSPDLGVLSASLTAAGPSDRSRLFGLAGPTSVRLSPTALPLVHTEPLDSMPAVRTPEAPQDARL